MAGEIDAWRGRGNALPKAPEIIGDRMRGYWDARIPRNPTWAIQRPKSKMQWDEAQNKYVGPAYA